MKYLLILILAIVQFTNGTVFKKTYLKLSVFDDFDSLYDESDAIYADLEEDSSSSSKPQYKLEEATKLFENFIKKYNKIYKDNEDKEKHYKVFVKNLKYINDVNSDPEISSTVDINNFADFTDEEKKMLIGTPLE